MGNKLVKLNIEKITELDQEIRSLVNAYSMARIKIGIGLGERLEKVESNKLYLKLGARSYTSFNSYVSSLGFSYKTARDVIGLYETYVVAANVPIDELVKISYNKLTVLKPFLFKKKDNVYYLVRTKKELRDMLTDAKSDISIDDLKQIRRDKEVGDHKHEWEIITTHICKICKLKEYKGKRDA